MSTQVTPKKFYADPIKQEVYICVEVDTLDDHKGAMVGLVQIVGEEVGSFEHCWQSTIDEIGNIANGVEDTDYLYYTNLENLVECRDFYQARMRLVSC